MPVNDKRVHPANPRLPNFEIAVNMKMEGRSQWAMELAEDASIILKFENDDDANKMMQFLWNKMHFQPGNRVGKIIQINGADVDTAARVLLDEVANELPTEALCELAYYFEKHASDKFPALNRLVEERLYKVFAENATLAGLHDKLSTLFSKTDITETKEQTFETKDVPSVEDGQNEERDTEIYDWVEASIDEEEKEEEFQYGWGREELAQPFSDESSKEELPDELTLIKQLKEANQYNDRIYQDIQDQCAKLEKIIADRNKITTAICYVLKKIVPLVVAEKIFERDVERLRNGTAALSIPSVPIGNLNRSATLDELTGKVNKLIARAKKSSTVEEHARDLLQWVSRKFTSAYKRAVSESPRETQAIVRKAVATRHVPGIFSSSISPNDHSESKNKENLLQRGRSPGSN
ncbi:MAG: hypothetical protein K0R24_1076 [Gammaproteobacteria bacterium]|jgi:hypothetical protein|nr:hypothetical protein [Gammaproteobacteria bacterium]